MKQDTAVASQPAAHTAPHSHHWYVDNLEEGIYKSVCNCGAVKYTPGDPIYSARANELNQLEAQKPIPTISSPPEVKPEGELPPVPPRPEGNIKVNKYYKANQKAILAEVARQGELATRKRWGIISSTWTQLKRRWGLPVESRKPGKRQVPLKPASNGAKQPEAATSRLVFPTFPAWSESWPPELQLRWMDLYEKLCLQGDGRELKHEID